MKNMGQKHMRELRKEERGGKSDGNVTCKLRSLRHQLNPLWEFNIDLFLHPGTEGFKKKNVTKLKAIQTRALRLTTGAFKRTSAAALDIKAFI